MSEPDVLAVDHRGIAALIIVGGVSLITGIDRFIVRVDDTNFRVELLVGGVALLASLYLLGKSVGSAFGVIEYLLLAWLGINLTSSLLFAPDLVESLKQAALLTGLLFIFFATLLPLRTRMSVFWASTLWVSIGAGVVALGLVQGILFTFFGITTGMHFNRSYVDGIFSAVPMVTGTVWEPNLFGSFSLAVALVAVALGFSPQLADRAWQWRMHACTAIGFAGVIVSMTRTVWLVAGLMVVVLLLASLRLGLVWSTEGIWSATGSIGAGVVVGLLIALTLPKISWATQDPGGLTLVQVAERAGMGVRGEPITGADVGTEVQQQSALADRAGELASVDQIPSLLIRQEVITNSFKGWLERPLLGWGTGSYPRVFVISPGAPNWIPNIFMHVLFDTGIVGLVLFCGALGAAGWRAFGKLRKPGRTWSAADFTTYGLLLASLALLLTYQLTDGTWMGFTWVVLAMLVASGKKDPESAGGAG